MRRGGAYRLILGGGDSPDIDEGERELTPRHRVRRELDERGSKLALVGSLALPRQFRVAVYCFLKPRPLAIRARRNHIGIRRPRDCPDGLFKALPQTGFA